MNRRAYLAHVVAGIAPALAGCLVGTVEPAEAEKGMYNRTEEMSDGSPVITYDIDVPQGRYARREWNPESEIIAEFRLFLQEHPGEFFVTPQDQLRDYENGKEISHLGPFHGTGRIIKIRELISPGSYYFLVDNTAFGQQSPEGDITGKLEVAV